MKKVKIELKKDRMYRMVYPNGASTIVEFIETPNDKDTEELDDYMFKYISGDATLKLADNPTEKILIPEFLIDMIEFIEVEITTNA